MTRLLLGLSVVLLLAGCLNRGGMSGDLTALVEAEVMVVHRALVDDIFRRPGISIEQVSQTDEGSVVQGRYDDGTSVTVETVPATGGTIQGSTVAIQVGTFGDNERAWQLLQDIRQRVER